MNGNWKKYRMDIYDTNIVVSSSDDGTDYDTIKEISNLRDRSNTSSEHHILLMRVSQPLLMDNLRIVKLTDSGSEQAQIYCQSILIPVKLLLILD